MLTPPAQHAPSPTLRLDDDLVAACESAARLGITRQAVASSRRRPTLSRPHRHLRLGAGVALAEVNQWLREHRRDRADAEGWPTADESAIINLMLLR